MTFRAAGKHPRNSSHMSGPRPPAPVAVPVFECAPPIGRICAAAHWRSCVFRSRPSSPHKVLVFGRGSPRLLNIFISLLVSPLSSLLLSCFSPLPLPTLSALRSRVRPSTPEVAGSNPMGRQSLERSALVGLSDPARIRAAASRGSEWRGSGRSFGATQPAMGALASGGVRWESSAWPHRSLLASR